jgi:hypothetical protein
VVASKFIHGRDLSFLYEDISVRLVGEKKRFAMMTTSIWNAIEHHPDPGQLPNKVRTKYHFP